ncbi:hypothetical protein K525DRAFT_275768 [Schizophyllum commune Loenen D]|nr:hypothetical protein K525DRAFT_275768 [Schizophyllum commune Loenen D]
MSRSYATVELPKEASARARRDAQKAATAAGQPALLPADIPVPKTRKAKTLNLSTYKFHALGDYVRSIKLYGTTDSYSTQLSELAHRLVKKLYQLTNKKDAMKQVATKYARLDFFRQMEKREKDELEELKDAPVDKPYVIAKSRKHWFDMLGFGEEAESDPARVCFVRKLREHLLGRRLNLQFDGDDYDFTSEDRRTIDIKNSRI